MKLPKWLKFLFTLLLGYVLLLLVYFLIQSHIIYHPRQNLNPPSEYGLQDFTIIHLNTTDGLSLKAWYHPAKASLPTILFFHGNAGHIGDRAPIVFPYFQAGYGIFLFEYRGYGDNPGTPNEKDNIRDAITAWNYLQQSTKPPHCIVAYGESLGTGVAVALAAQRKVSAVILQSPFTSLDNVAKHHYPFLPVSWLLQEHYNSLSQIAHINSPLFIIHGDVDSVIPIQNSYLLYQQAYSPKELAIAPGKSHNDLDSTWMANNVISFLRKNVHCSPNSST